MIEDLKEITHKTDHNLPPELLLFLYSDTKEFSHMVWKTAELVVEENFISYDFLQLNKPMYAFSNVRTSDNVVELDVQTRGEKESLEYKLLLGQILEDLDE